VAIAADLISEVLTRVRDPNGTAHSRQFVLRMVTEAQRLVNAETRALLGEAVVTVDSTNSLLDITGLLPTDCIRVETIRDGLRDITKAPSWRTLAQADRRWRYTKGSIVSAWAPIGPMRVALYPALTTPTDLTLVFTRRPPALTESTPIDLPEPLQPALVNLVEQILLCRHRLYPSQEVAQGRFDDVVQQTTR